MDGLMILCGQAVDRPQADLSEAPLVSFSLLKPVGTVAPWSAAGHPSQLIFTHWLPKNVQNGFPLTGLTHSCQDVRLSARL